MTKKIFGTMVVKNEVDRYLEQCILWHQNFLDQIFVYDDQSTDGSGELCKDLGCIVVRRSDGVPSFLEHEGAFRLAAWHAFETMCKPGFSDWILAVDADEFLVSESDKISVSLKRAINAANKSKSPGIILPFKEIFKTTEDGLYFRTDGLWRTVRGPRLFRYLNDATWTMKAMGCGAEPRYVSRGKNSSNNFGLTMLHMGYARKEDQIAKHRRYSSLADHGHSNKHIASIIQPARLELWQGMVPQI